MTELELARLFPQADEAQWMALVQKALKGGDFERRLVSRTADGVSIRPLYRREAVGGVGGDRLPGEAPFLRGGAPAGTSTGWSARQIYADIDPVAANAAILDDLAGGISAVTLQIAAPGSFGLNYEGQSLKRALDGVHLDACPVALDAGEYTPDAAGSLLAIWTGAGLSDAQKQGAFNYDPLGTLLATGALYHPLDRAMGVAASVLQSSIGLPNVTALAANGTHYHNAGATEAQELAAVVTSIIAYLRAAEAKGIGPDSALPKIAVELAADADQFLTIAKLRAVRRLIWRVAEACGAGQAAGQVKIGVETSRRMMTRRDPWVNMLRTTMACAAAAMGGAERITVLPFTFALGMPDAFARRIARNTHHVLMEESSLGRVADPAGGSWFVEQLTDELAKKAWAEAQEIEGKGGLGAAIASGFVQDRIAGAVTERTKRMATGRQELTGTSAFPKLGDDGVTVAPWPADRLPADLNGARAKAMPATRLAEPFERLRDAADATAKRTGKAPVVFLASLGPLAVHSGRSTWIRNFLAAGGVEGTVSDGFTASADVGRAFAESGATVACLCSSDEVYGELGEATASLLKSAGAKRVYLAGRPRDTEAALKAAGVDEFIFMGCDAIETLTRLHGALDVR